ncbi:MAG: hypothetical protein R3C14_40480 [Caldilineaceae bacterium]
MFIKLSFAITVAYLATALYIQSTPADIYFVPDATYEQVRTLLGEDQPVDGYYISLPQGTDTTSFFTAQNLTPSELDF